MKFLKLLHGFCLFAEFAVALGAGLGVFGVLHSASQLSSKKAKVGVFFDAGGCNVSVISQLAPGGTYSNDSGRLSVAEVPDGSLTIGPVNLGAVTLDSKNLSKTVVPGPSAGIPPLTLRAANTVATVEDPQRAREGFGRLEVPLIADLVLTAAIWIGILKSLRRLFRKVAEGEAFGADSLPIVYRIGGLLIASTLVRVATTTWVGMEATLALERWLPSSNLLIQMPHSGGISGFAAGVVVLALAEVFRQGFRLAEESKLTI